MKTVLLFCALQVICFASASGQYKVLLTENKEIAASDIEVHDNSVFLTKGDGRETLKKSDILCVISEKGKGYTFRKKNGKKLKVLKKDIKNNYREEDIARLFAYKYYKSDVDIGRLYSSFPGLDLTKDEFESAFLKQQKKFKSRTIVSASIAGFVFLLGLGAFISTLAEASSVQ